MSGKPSRRRHRRHRQNENGGASRPAQPESSTTSSRVDTIRAAILRASGSPGSPIQAANSGVPASLQEAIEVLPRVSPTDVSEAYRWFWDVAPDQEDFSYGHIPSLITPGYESASITGGKSATILLEGQTPGRAFPWASPLVGEEEMLAGAVPTLSGSELMDAAGRADVGAAINEGVMADGAASTIVFDAGLVARAGALVDWAPGEIPDWAQQWFEGLVERPVAISAGKHPTTEEIAGTLSLLPYALLRVPGEHDQEQNGQDACDEVLSTGVVDASPITYQLPVTTRGRAIVADEEAMPIGITDQRLDGEHDTEEIGAMLRAQRAVMLAVLFSVSCFNESLRTDGRCRLLSHGNDGYGPVNRLSMAQLEDDLGRRTHQGLSRSLLTLDHYVGG